MFGLLKQAEGLLNDLDSAAAKTLTAPGNDAIAHTHRRPDTTVNATAPTIGEPIRSTASIVKKPPLTATAPVTVVSVPKKATDLDLAAFLNAPPTPPPAKPPVAAATLPNPSVAPAAVTEPVTVAAATVFDSAVVDPKS